MRIVNRLLAFALALALLAVGVILIVEVIAANTNAAPVIFDWHAMFRWGQRNTWQATSVEITCGIVALVGLLLLLPQLRRRRPNRFALTSEHAATDVALTRSGVRNAVRGAVDDVDGAPAARCASADAGSASTPPPPRARPTPPPTSNPPSLKPPASSSSTYGCSGPPASPCRCPAPRKARADARRSHESRRPHRHRFIALVLGVGGLLAAAGVFGPTFQERRVLDNRLARYFGAHGHWLWPAIAAVVFVVVLLVLLWLVRLLFSTDRTGDIALTPDSAGPDAVRTGRTTVQASALTRAVTTEIEQYRGVTGAKARVVGESLDATLVLEVSASRRADLPGLLQRIESEAVQHVRDALEEPDFPVKLDVTINDKAVARAG